MINLASELKDVKSAAIAGHIRPDGDRSEERRVGKEC